MTSDEIIRMAREAGFQEYLLRVYRADEGIERFARAAYEAGAAAERERIIAANAPEIERINAELSEWKKFPMAAMLAAEKAVDAAIALEREAMLDLVDDYAKGNTDLKAAIRARGQK